MDEFSVDVGEPEIAALGAVGEAGMIQSEEMQERGVEIVDVDWIFDGVEPEIIGGSEGLSAPDAPTG